MSLCNPKSSHLFIRVPTPPPCLPVLPVPQTHPINSLILKCSSNFCLLLLEHIPCLIFPVKTSTKHFQCQLLHEALLDLLKWTMNIALILSHLLSFHVFGEYVMLIPASFQDLAESRGYIQTLGWQTHWAVLFRWHEKPNGREGYRALWKAQWQTPGSSSEEQGRLLDEGA